MSNLPRWQSGTAAFLALGIAAGAIAPIFSAAPSFAQSTTFSDVSSNYWARNFISELASRDIIAGFPDGTFRPDTPVTRAQFAAMMRKANKEFNKGTVRDAIQFSDVPSTYWAYTAIQDAYTTGFLAGYPGNVFRPEQNIPREQVLTSLANGLNYSPTQSVSTDLSYYNDASSISNFARSPIAAATEKGIVVNYANLKTLNPLRNATRAEVAAFIYQALVSSGNAQAINSPYIVNAPQVATDVTIPAGTSIPVTYDKDKILVTKDETVPLTVKVAANITTSDGRVLIPAGSTVTGELRPVKDQGGSQFVAQKIVIDGQEKTINASSDVITTTETVRKGINVGNLVKNAVLGTAAAAAVAAVTGDRAIATEELLIGGGAGVVLNLIQTFLGRNSIDLIAIQPNTDLNLKLLSPLTVTAK
ncbi:S-layer homology domain-containing protein [Allocoleopsis sp.]|uniref:S-layer homology domain-containing protein n=1 Tax=Allocoleopsis sp. TaxID=3088169 RepID=UPI002FD3F119